MCLSGEPGAIIARELTRQPPDMSRVPSPELAKWPLADLLEELRTDSLPAPAADVKAEITRRVGVLRAALVGLVGSDNVEELKAMAVITEDLAPPDVKDATLNAIRVLIETAGALL